MQFQTPEKRLDNKTLEQNVRKPTPAKTIKKNAETAAGLDADGDRDCPTCKRVGLAILPLRYAVVPSFLEPHGLIGPQTFAGLQLPGPELIRHNPPLHAHLRAHRLAVRTLRAGFVMVYLGGGNWQAYAVDAAGYLCKLADPKSSSFVKATALPVSCVREGKNVPASFINIPRISINGRKALPKKIWIAFSETAWTATVQREFEGAEGRARRSQRMQEYDVDQLGRQADAVPHAFQLGAAKPASAPEMEEESIAGRLRQLVFEYAEGDGRRTWNDSDERQHTWEGKHKVTFRPREADALARHAAEQARSRRDRLAPSAVVLFDPVGVVQETNETRLGMTFLLMEYLQRDDIARPLLISQAIVGLKNFVEASAGAELVAEEKAKEFWLNVGDTIYETTPEQEGFVWMDFKSYTNLKQRAEAQGKPAWQVAREEGERHGLNVGDTMFLEFSDESGTHILRELFTTRKDRAKARGRATWAELQEHYYEDARLKFEQACQKQQDAWNDWIDRSSDDYAVVLADHAWQETKTDHDVEVDAQQEKLIGTYNEALAGGPVEAKVHGVWKHFLSLAPDAEKNPVYVALFGNRPNFLEYLVPDVPVPGDGVDDKIDKGHKLYKIVRALTTFPLKNESLKAWRQGKYKLGEAPPGSKAHSWRAPLGAFKNELLGNPQNAQVWQASMKRMGLRCNKTLMALSTAIGGPFAQELTAAARGTGVLAVQAAVRLYEGKEIVLLTTDMAIDEYLAVFNDIKHPRQLVARPMVRTGLGRARSFARGGIHIADPEIRKQKISVTLWCSADAVAEFEKGDGLHKPPRGLGKPSAGALTAVDGELLRLHPFNLSPAGEKMLEALRYRFRTPAASARFFIQDTFRFAVSGTAFMGNASLFFQCWSFWDTVKKADASFLGNNEIRSLVGSTGLAAVSALGEVAGQWAKLIVGNDPLGTTMTKVSWTVAGLAGIGEGIMAWIASERTSAGGDRDATNLYRCAAAFYLVSSLLSAVGSYFGATVFGLFGWGLVALAAGLMLNHLAIAAEDTPIAIWLDRCYWGHHDRYRYSNNATQRPWDDPATALPWSKAERKRVYANLDAEISELNSLLIGLDAEVGFNDDLSYLLRLAARGGQVVPYAPSYSKTPEDDWEDTIKMRITFPFFDADRSAYAWRLCLRDHDGGVVEVTKGNHGDMPGDPFPAASRVESKWKDTSFRTLLGPTSKNGKSAFGVTLNVEATAQVSTFFDRVLLDIDYVNDTVADPEGRSSIRLVVDD